MGVIDFLEPGDLSFIGLIGFRGGYCSAIDLSTSSDRFFLSFAELDSLKKSSSLGVFFGDI